MQLVGISKAFRQPSGTLEILKNVNLDLHPGKKVAIVGQSGSGKSTLLQIAGLLDKPTAGEVRLDGASVTPLGDTQKAHLRNKTFGFVYQYHHLLAEFTALENVMMPALIGNKNARDAQRMAEGLLEAVGLTERMAHHPAHLSGGEQQRVALARALMNKPRVLLADEPTGNLDPHSADAVFNLFTQLADKDGLSVLMVTHNTELAKKCDVVYTMREGGVED
ncbi:MAG: ATP-binding cassette domain-containing protein [Proteobacteria bacterium]|nr:ATP-binding cassette domain-containing protein [Pseudomonadota bacterium]